MAKAPDRTPWDGVIVTDPEVCFGKPRINGTRLYIDVLLAQLEAGSSLNEIADGYPDITRVQLMAMMGFVRDLVAGKRNRLSRGLAKADHPAATLSADLARLSNRA